MMNRPLALLALLALGLSGRASAIVHLRHRWHDVPSILPCRKRRISHLGFESRAVYSRPVAPLPTGGQAEGSISKCEAEVRQRLRNVGS